MSLKIDTELEQELQNTLSLVRLTKVGFFVLATCPDEKIYPYLRLYRTVLDKALLDLFSPNDEVRLDVEDWLDLDNPNFIEACERALLPPEGVYEVFKIFKKTLTGDKAKLQGFVRHNFCKETEENNE